jgi:hypothetical protein
VFDSPPAAVSSGPNLIDVFGIGGTKEVFQKSFDGSLRNFHMRGDHSGIVVSDKAGANERFISLADGMPAPGGMSAWAPRWAMYDVRFFTHGGPYPGGDGRAGDVYLCQFDETLTKMVKRIRLSTDPHTDTQACAWIKPAGASSGGSSWDAIEAKLLAAEVKRMQKAKTLKPAIEELRKIAADPAKAERAAEAQSVIDQLLAWGKAALAAAIADEGADVAEAAARYKELASVYAGLETGDAAAAKLASAGFKRELQAWDAYRKALDAEEKFKPVPGAQANAKDEAWMKANKSKLQGLVRMVRDLQKTFADTAGAKAAQALLDKYQVGPDDLK